MCSFFHHPYCKFVSAHCHVPGQQQTIGSTSSFICQRCITRRLKTTEILEHMSTCIPCGWRSAAVSQSVQVHSSFMCGEHLHVLSHPGCRVYHSLVVTVTPGLFLDRCVLSGSSAHLNTSPLWFFLRNHHPFV